MVALSLLLAASSVTTLAPVAPVSPVAVRDIVETREISGVAVSPDEKWVAYRVAAPSVEKNRVDLAWYIVPSAGGPPRKVADGGEARFDFAGVIEEDAPVWDADSKGFHYLARRNGISAIWAWRDGSPPRAAITDDADIIRFWAAPDGSALVYSAGASRAAIAAAEKRDYDEGLLVDRHVDLMQPVAGGAIVDGKRVMQRLPGPWFERTRLLSGSPPVTKTVALARKAARAGASAFEGSRPDTRKTQAADGAAAEIISWDGGQLVRITKPNGAVTECREGACASPTLRAIIWRPRTDELLLFVAGAGSEEQLWKLAPGQNSLQSIASTDGAPPSSTRPPRCAVASQFLACAEAVAVEPPRLMRIDLSSGKKDVIADPNAALRARIRTQAKAFEWDNGSGTHFSGILLSRKKVSQPAPLVIQYYHCDGFLKGGVGDELPMIPLTEAGISVLCIRKARAPDGQPTQTEYDLALSGIGAAIDQLEIRGLIDPKRVGIGGLSFGSQVALWAVRKSKRFTAATLASGQFEPYFYWAYALPGSGIPGMLENYWGLGDPDQDRDGWDRLSAVSDINTLDTPLLMQLPESEARLVVEFHTRLKRAGKSADLYVFADEPHIKTQPIHQHAVNMRNLDWYKFWLLGFQDKTPSKAEQFARWQRYRAGQSLPVPAP